MSECPLPNYIFIIYNRFFVASVVKITKLLLFSLTSYTTVQKLDRVFFLTILTQLFCVIICPYIYIVHPYVHIHMSVYICLIVRPCLNPTFCHVCYSSSGGPTIQPNSGGRPRIICQAGLQFSRLPE